MTSGRIALAPTEGWLSLVLVTLACLTMAWAIDDARWVLGRPDYLDFLVLAAIGGTLSGFIGPKVRWGRWRTFFIGSIFAALIVPILTGSVAYPHGASIGQMYDATATAVVDAYRDLAIYNLSSTVQFLHYVLTLGLLVWATSMFASYSVFGHRRPLGGLVVVGVILVGNMSLTLNDELGFLVVFTIAALFLLIRAHVFDEQTEWLRRRIGDPATISTVYLRGGSLFIVSAVVMAMLLTNAAASAPLAGAWDGVEDGLITLSRSVQRFLPTGGSTRAVGLAFGPNAQVGQIWTTDTSPAVTIARNPADKTHYYWRAVTYDQIDLKGWSQTDTTTAVIPAAGRIEDQLADDVDRTARRSVTFTVSPEDFRATTILSPATPNEINQSVRLSTVGKDGYFATLDRTGPSEPYTVTALTPTIGNDPGQLNDAALEATGTDYPQEIKDLYLGGLDSMGPNANALEAKIVAEAKSKAPFDLANQLVTELHSSTYTYSTDIRDVDCSTLSTVECFATYKTGFCQYYAATMAVILRDLGIPTRIAEGFLPGTIDPNTGIETVLFSNSHAWVEVYFVGYGWVSFDPTGGGVSQILPLPSGVPVASTGPKPSSSTPGAVRPQPIDVGDNGSNPGGGPASGRGGLPSLGPLVAVGFLLLLVVGALAFVTWQRGPRGGTSADGAYGTVVRIASRLGFGPRPAQTVYEYAGSLGEVLPTVRPELEMVARAKVESVYAREILSQDRIDSLRQAQRRLRVGLLRLAFRRKDRKRK
jgi:transglutaminase-like putative cysteine protease